MVQSVGKSSRMFSFFLIEKLPLIVSYEHSTDVLFAPAHHLFFPFLSLVLFICSVHTETCLFMFWKSRRDVVDAQLGFRP